MPNHLLSGLLTGLARSSPLHLPPPKVASGRWGAAIFALMSLDPYVIVIAPNKTIMLEMQRSPCILRQVRRRAMINDCNKRAWSSWGQTRRRYNFPKKKASQSDSHRQACCRYYRIQLKKQGVFCILGADARPINEAASQLPMRYFSHCDRDSYSSCTIKLRV